MNDGVDNVFCCPTFRSVSDAAKFCDVMCRVTVLIRPEHSIRHSKKHLSYFGGPQVDKKSVLMAVSHRVLSIH